MRQIIIAAMLTIISLAGQAKEKVVVWEHPAAMENTYIDGDFGTLLEITRVELAADETRVTMHLAMSYRSSLRFVSATYLLADGKRYALRSCDGLALDDYVRPADHGQADVVFHFEPLPVTTSRFDFIEGDDDRAFRILGVESAETRAGRLFPSNWRNEKTGDWEIGFYDDFAIYDCRFWSYRQRQQRGDRYTFVLECGGEELTVSVGKAKGGRRTIAIGDRRGDYSVVSSIALPDYPVKDTRTTFRDTRYETDTVTLVGWLRDMPQKLRKKGNEFVVMPEDIFTADMVSHYGKIDSIGRFVVKIPLLNTSEVRFDWEHTFIRTVFEPGETYFLLYDYREGHKLFMGRDSRLQNETLAHPIGWIGGDRRGEMDEDAAMRFLDSMKKVKADEMAWLERTVAAHPDISGRYVSYLTGSYNTCEGRELMQARYNMKSRNMPDGYLDYVTRQHWQERSRPYTLYGEFSTFIRDYTQQLVDMRYGVKGPRYTFTVSIDMEAPVLRRYRAAGKVAITDEELAVVERYSDGFKECCTKEGGEAQQQALAELGQSDCAKQYVAITEREDIKSVLEAERPLLSLYHTLSVIDSVGCDNDLRDIIITRYLYGLLDHERQPLDEKFMRFFEDSVSMPAAKTFLRACQEKYLAIQRRDITSSGSLRQAADVADMSDGEQILRKLTEPYRGRIVLLDIWGTWCSPCKQALSQSKEEYERLKDYGLVYLYLANRSDDNAWRNVIKEYDLIGDDIVHYNLPADQQSAVEHFLGVRSFPSYRLINRDGNVLDVNADPRNLEALARLLEQMK